MIKKIKIGFIGGCGWTAPKWEHLGEVYVQEDLVVGFLKMHTHYPETWSFKNHYMIKRDSHLRQKYQPHVNRELLMLLVDQPIKIIKEL